MFDLYAHIPELFDQSLSSIIRQLEISNLPGIKRNSIKILPPNITVKDALVTNQTYSCRIVATVDDMVDVELFTIPLMLGSVYSTKDIPYNTHGHFVVEGQERVILSQEVRISDRVRIDKPGSGQKDATELRSEFRMPDSLNGFRSVEISVDKQGILRATTSHMSTHLKRKIRDKRAHLLNIYIFGEFLDINPDEFTDRIISWSKHSNAVKTHLLYTRADQRKNPSHIHIGRYFSSENYEIKQTILEDTFPGYDRNTLLSMVSLMVCRLIETYLGIRQIDDPDDMSRKRVDSAGMYISWSVIRYIKYHILRDISSKDSDTILSELKNIGDILVDNILQDRWSSRYRSKVSGITQNLSRKSRLDSISHVRRINVVCEESSTDIGPRQIHKSQLGFVCPCETPEGRTVGLVKNLSSTCIISEGVSDKLIRREFDQENLERVGLPLFVNGIYANHIIEEEARIIYDKLKLEYIYLSYSTDSEAIYIYCDSSRYVRPLVDIRTSNTIYVDPSEQSTSKIAWFDAEAYHTYREIHPWVFLGFPALTVPYAAHNQSTRISFQASMVKQAITSDPLFYQDIIPDSRFLVYGQKPLCSNFVAKETESYPTGDNVTICILAYSGYNQEDALIFNRASVDRGLFRNTKLSIQVIERSDTNQEVFVNGCFDSKHDKDGIIKVGQKVTRKHIASRIFDGERTRSVYCNVSKGVVQNIITFSTNTNTQVVKVLYKTTRVPQIGDKFASRHAQKGVIGILLSQEDMPFTEEGMTPDVIINPHAIPSRMTVGHIIEMITGKYCAIDGVDIDSHNTNLDHIKFRLNQAGFSCDGKDIMYAGETGKILNGYVFTGICYYQALKHQVEEKAYIRGADGPVHSVNRQPTSGLASGGGMRFGEMEKDALIAYGATELLKEKLSADSDITTIMVCSECQLPLQYTEKCMLCESSKVVNVDIPYSFKLLIQELQTANIDTRLNLK